MNSVGYRNIFQVISDKMKLKLMQYMLSTFRKAIVSSNREVQLRLCSSVIFGGSRLERKNGA